MTPLRWPLYRLCGIRLEARGGVATVYVRGRRARTLVDRALRQSIEDFYRDGVMLGLETEGEVTRVSRDGKVVIEVHPR